jgi:hypothetical protein
VFARLLGDEGNEGNLFLSLFKDIYVGNKSVCWARRNIAPLRKNSEIALGVGAI